MPSKECQVCGDNFEKKPTESYEKFKDKKYCSRQCYYDSKGMEQHGKSRGTKGQCPNCDEAFTRSRNKQKYCSQSCATKHQYDNGERDKDEQVKKAQETRKEQGMEKFKSNPTTRIGKRGYKLIYIPAEHSELEQGWLKHHHFVWWQNKGELPPEDKVVHHKNGDKTDNRFENLELMDNAEHVSMHAEKAEDSKIEVQCEWCGDTFEVYPCDKERRRCCSQSCIAKLWSEER